MKKTYMVKCLSITASPENVPIQETWEDQDIYGGKG
jgi:hypothetical protein